MKGNIRENWSNSHFPLSLCLCICLFCALATSVTNFYLEMLVLSDQKMFFGRALYQHCGSLFVLHKHLHLNHPWETADVLLCLSYCKANGSARVDQKMHHHN